MIPNLEGFMYTSSLDLYMGHYHIQLSPGSKHLCNIVLTWGNEEAKTTHEGLQQSGYFSGEYI